MDGVFYTDFYELLERFSIMTIDGGQSDIEAMNYCREHTTPELAAELEARFIKRPNMEASAPKNADFETLAKYINAGFEVYPCLYSQKDNCYIHAYYKGGVLHYGLYETPEQKEAKERHGITDPETLKTLCTETIKDEYGRQQKTTLFRIYPTDNNFIVIDIDTHEGKANGLVQWHNYLKKNALDGNKQFSDLANFPCYTESANGGKHLYFKYPYDYRGKIKKLASSVEISDFNHTETAAGSYREGTKNGFYILHGEFKNAPLLPLCIYNDMKDEPPAPATKQFRGNFQRQDGNPAPIWNQTLEGIAEKARAKATSGNHDFINWFCVYAEKANADTDRPTNYTKSEIESFLFSLPEVIDHETRKKGDTQSCINSHHFN